MKIFWSWQSDTHGKTGRHFVREALSQAIEELRQDQDLDEAERPDGVADLHLDQDRAGVPGSPDLATVILDKIARSVVFVADVTPVGRVDGEGSNKRLINPNVAIELGWALRSIGDSGLLMVMNEHYGTHSDLPFDLRHKAGPTTYRLAPTATKPEIDAERKRLKGNLRTALELCLERCAPEPLRILPFAPRDPADGPARFRTSGEPIGVGWSSSPFGVDGSPKIFLSEGPAVWIRLFPAAEPKRTWSSLDLKEAIGNPLTLKPLTFNSARFLRADDGFGICSTSASPDQTGSVVFAFETGEVWSVDTDIFLGLQDQMPLIERKLEVRVQDYARFLRNLEIKPPFAWIGGLSGVKDLFFAPSTVGQNLPSLSRHQCLSEVIEAEGSFDGSQTPRSALLPLFEKIFEKCGLRRSDFFPN